MSKQRIPQTEVLEWLHANHPDLHTVAEIERAWVWITGDALKPCHKGCTCDACKDKAEKRKSIGAYGFIWCRDGHHMPSGKIGTWSHSCEAPRRFSKRDRKSGDDKGNNQPTASQDADAEKLFAEAMELIGS